MTLMAQAHCAEEVVLAGQQENLELTTVNVAVVVIWI
jgi:hypothetical protein